jgi:hypothetical protein
MKNFQLMLLLVSFIFILTETGCKKKKDDSLPPLSNSYGGSIAVEYTKGFPPFSVTVPMDVSIGKDRTITFGAGGSKNFDEVDTLFTSGKPETKIHMAGTVTFHDAKGEYKEISGTEYLWVWVHSTISGQMTIWAYDEELGWIQVFDTPFSYEDVYSDGQMEFSIDDAVMAGASIKKTLPDIQGTFTYGYLLTLTVGL